MKGLSFNLSYLILLHFFFSYTLIFQKRKKNVRLVELGWDRPCGKVPGQNNFLVCLYHLDTFFFYFLTIINDNNPSYIYFKKMQVLKKNTILNFKNIFFILYISFKSRV